MSRMSFHCLSLQATHCLSSFISFRLHTTFVFVVKLVQILWLEREDTLTRNTRRKFHIMHYWPCIYNRSFPINSKFVVCNFGAVNFQFILSFNIIIQQKRHWVSPFLIVQKLPLWNVQTHVYMMTSCFKCPSERVSNKNTFWHFSMRTLSFGKCVHHQRLAWPRGWCETGFKKQLLVTVSGSFRGKWLEI